MQKLLLSLYLLCIPAFIYALEPCGEMDLRQDLGSIRDQSDKGWCFAHAGADLLTAAYKNELQGKQVSSSMVALHYFFTESFMNKHEMNSIFGDGGNVFQAINIIDRGKWLCFQDIDSKMMRHGMNVELTGKLNKFKQLYERYQEYKITNNPAKLSEVVVEISQSGSFLLHFNRDAIERSLAKPTLDEAAFELIGVVCRDNSITIDGGKKFQHYFKYDGGKVWDVRNHRYHEKLNLLEEINHVLDQRKPVAFVYEVSKVLTTSAIAQGLHASVIVKRNWNLSTQKCEYLVRNSWGTSCKTYVQNANGTEEVDIYKSQCEKGHFWLTEDQMRELTSEVIFETRAITKTIN